MKRPNSPGYVTAARAEEFIYSLQELIDEFVSDAYIQGDLDAEETHRNDSIDLVGQDGGEGDSNDSSFGPLKPPSSLAKNSKKVSV